MVVMSPFSQPIYFGSSAEIMPNVDRTRIKTLHLVLKWHYQIRQLKKLLYRHAQILILSAIGSRMGIYAFAKSFKKDVYICSSTQG